MSSIKPSLPKGMRDFSPTDLQKRNYIFDTIRTVFKKYGYQAIETPTMENLQTLTGKYGDEGDKLIFKVLNSGDFLGGIDTGTENSKSITPKISEKALRYDLTVPFARYVVMHQNDIALPFKRYQIQPVWRADRPQRGRYREFYQCDVDVVGSSSLLHEAEFISIYDEALSTLGLKDFTILVNNRKILAAIAESIGKSAQLESMTIAIDKLDKIGIEGVSKELQERGFTEKDIEAISTFFGLKGSNDSILSALKTLLQTSELGQKGIAELAEMLEYSQLLAPKTAKVQIDLTLARGLNYYTGAIFEVKTNEVAMGSIGGGGRYDDLTGMFGLKNLTGVGVSFGADRIFDVLEELGRFPADLSQSTKVLITQIEHKAFAKNIEILQALRSKGIAAELYPENTKLQKQLKYADAKNVAFVVLIGESEWQNQKATVKNMLTGTQETIDIDKIAGAVSREER